jgi:hypothetical protein
MSLEVMFVSLFHLGGHPRNPSHMLSLLGKRSIIGGSLKEVV